MTESKKFEDMTLVEKYDDGWSFVDPPTRVFRWEPMPKETWIEWEEGTVIPEGTNLVYVKQKDLFKFLRVLEEHYRAKNSSE